ncbi:MAG: hypothetical protein K0R65_2790 [Crocinitomicaceae bacterium]|jgi:plasmid rolling circle replication initiator protein Rep|nr:hypothetical protein [Crocinitomicaceae bacterium]
MMLNDFSPRKKGQIYTLAQSGTKKVRKPAVTVLGRGSEMIDSETAQKKAKQKMIAQTLSLNLADIAAEKGKAYLVKQAWNTYFCMSNVTFADGKMFGFYCKNRFCPVCSNIRKAEEIKKYRSTIESWPEPYFVTLTVKACKNRGLKVTVKAMFKAMRNIQDRQKKNEARKGDFHLMGIRSLECNFNPVKNTYNPHFHLIVPDKKTAEFLINNWLQRVGKKHTNRDGQDMREIKNTTRDLIEVIKYGFKIFTDPEMKKKTKARNRAVIYAKAQMNIIDAFHGHRIFERFGFNLPKQDQQTEPPQRLNEYESLEYDLKRHDWVNVQTDEVLTEYLPDENLVQILGFQVDKEKE